MKITSLTTDQKLEEGSVISLCINGADKNYSLHQVCYITNKDGNVGKRTYYTHEVFKKTEEELSAEESVKKAEAALEAAKNTLKIIKEGK